MVVFPRRTEGLTLTNVSPMAGLFPLMEQPAVLDMLEHAVVFLTPSNIAQVVRTTRWLHTGGASCSVCVPPKAGNGAMESWRMLPVNGL